MWNDNQPGGDEMPRQTKGAVDEQEVLTAQEVAEKLRVTPKTVHNMAASGTLPAFRVGRLWRFNAKDVQNLVETPKETKAQDSEDKAVRIRAYEAFLGPRSGSLQERSIDDLLGGQPPHASGASS
jgi:excisionase family DNA binding protein